LLSKSKLSKHSEKMLAHYAENGSVRVERVNEDLDYTAAFEFLQKFYQEEESRERAATSSSTFKASAFNVHVPSHDMTLVAQVNRSTM
jgi:hypothetical protein